jgi:ethanolamine utilization protein EutN
MRLGIVRGHVTLNLALESLRGRTLLIVEPVTHENLCARNGLGGGKALVAVDLLGAAEGQMVAFTEGREAANPFWPDAVPIDACCGLIVDSIDVRQRSSISSNTTEVRK